MTDRWHTAFKLDPKSGIPLYRQFAEGLTESIRSETFLPGDVLPSVSDWAKALGCSVFVPRKAMGILARQNVLSIKKHVGATVTGRLNQTRKKRSVLYITVDNGDIWSRNVFAFHLGDILWESGFRFRHISIRRDCQDRIPASLKDEIRQGVDFALFETSNPDIMAPLKKAGIPFAVIATGQKEFPGAKAVFRHIDATLAQQIVSLLKRTGCHRIIHVGYGKWTNDYLSAAIYSAGIRIQRHNLDTSFSATPPEQWERSAMRKFEERLSHGKDWLPDAFIFSDDYIAAGALHALMHNSVRIPEDVKVLTLANKGLGPVFQSPLTRFELDNEANARKVARWICSALSGRTPPPPICLTAKLIRGKTL